MDFAKYKEKVKNTFSKQALKNFLNKQGFYIILFICICAIGATAFWTSTNRNDRLPMQEQVEEDIANGGKEQGDSFEQPVQQTDASSDADKVDIKIKDVVLDETSREEQKGDTSKSKDNKVDGKSKGAADKSVPVSTVADKPNTVQAGATTQSQKSSKILMQQPVKGKIGMDFAMDHLQYSRTLKEWTTHPGIDIECPLGSEVRAALDGVVETIEEDSLMGIIITIDHGNGLKTRYANLSTKDMVTPNQQVKKGQIISGVGRTAISEILDPPHLHFEVLKDGENVDPKEYLQ